MGNTLPKIFLRVDGSRTIGYGHVFRCIALAQMLSKEFHCVFITRPIDSFITSAILSTGFQTIELPLDDSHFSSFLEILQGNELVVIDNYFFNTEYQKQIKLKGCKLVCIDDMYDKHYYADIVINHAEGIDHRLYSLESYTNLLLGYNFVLLRPEFLKAAKQEKALSGGKKNVLISLGGTDPEELIIKIANTILKHPNTDSLSVISRIDCSRFNNPESKQISQYWGLSAVELSELMLKVDIGFLPASTISIEACACRLPIIGGWFVDNQINSYNAIVDKSLAVGIGNINELSEGDLYKAISEISKKEVAESILLSQARAIDGCSDRRIREAFLKL